MGAHKKKIEGHMRKNANKGAAGKNERTTRGSNHSLNPNRSKEYLKGVAKPRDSSTIKRLQMYRNFKPKRDKKGHIVRPAPFQSRVAPGEVSRIEPNQKWFGNTRVVTQNSLQKFQAALGTALKDSYQVVLRQTKLPVTLLQEKGKQTRVHVLDTEPFSNTYGPKAQRKRAAVPATDLQELVTLAEAKTEGYSLEKDKDREKEDDGVRDLAREPIMKAGQSKRIWGELYKVIDSSDVVIQVLDARDPQGTRSHNIEKFLREEKSHKHLILVLNKCDLVPTSVTRKWVQHLSAEYPTLAFHASMKNPFGKGALINLLRQFGKLHQDKKQISVGFIGYPNTGKSSVINALRSKKVCNVAPIAGETKVWQYVTLMKRIYLIDCPGVVYPHEESDTEKVLKGVVRVELVDEPQQYIQEVINRVGADRLCTTYGFSEAISDSDEFLAHVARRSGKLLRKGEPDLRTAAKMVLNDWQRGKLPYFVPPPNWKPTSKDSAEDDEGERPLEDVEVVQESGEEEGVDVEGSGETLEDASMPEEETEATEEKEAKEKQQQPLSKLHEKRRKIMTGKIVKGKKRTALKLARRVGAKV
ncbi:unnamed protein product [Cyprideis torosa]|uniref:Nucleolar GTP-binding protein 2 n=1 Tax=Cyprideis torosa TaxID=163714 RepID=A0A7R8W431_9CRUS|nr:unnamed protein product [Cyprideis torosa]CAG0883671.1 unnamed protein product [Cyprideis torosa]